MDEVILGDGVVAIDAEITCDMTNGDARFKTPWELPVSVVCTLSDKDGFRDWIGDHSVPKLVQYLLKFNRIVGFNQIRFDYGLLDGALIREFCVGDDAASRVRAALKGHFDLGQRDPEPNMLERILKGKSIDLLVDIKQFLDAKKLPWKGRVTNLDAIALAMIGAGKESKRFKGGAEAPKAWRHRMALEVISYCRIDVLRAAQIYLQLLQRYPLKIRGWPAQDVDNTFDIVTLTVR